MISDDFGNELAVGDRVLKTAIDDGAPMWAGRGFVIGFGRVRPRVQWDSWFYDDAFPYHTPRPTALRKLNPDGTVYKGDK